MISISRLSPQMVAFIAAINLMMENPFPTLPPRYHQQRGSCSPVGPLPENIRFVYVAEAGGRFEG